MTSLTLFFKRVLWTLAAILGVTVLSLALVLAFLGTDSGKNFVTSTINDSLEKSPYQARINKIISLYPLKVDVDSVSLTEGKKEWLSVSGITVDIDLTNPLSEDRRHLKATLFVDVIDVRGLPAGDENKKEDTTPLDLDALRKDLENKLPLSAEISVTLRKVKVAPSVATLDLAVAPLKLTASYDRDFHNLAAKLNLSTKSLGSPLTALVSIKGPLTNLDAVMALKTSSLTYNNIHLTGVTLKSSTTGLPFDFSESLNLDFTYHGLGEKGVQGHLKVNDLTLKETLINLKSLSVRGLGAVIDGTASYDLATQEIKANLKGNLQNLSPLTGLFGYPLQGSLTLQSKVHMTADSQDITAKIQGHNLKNKDFSINDLAVDLDTSALSALPTLSATVKANNLESSGIKLKELALISHMDKGQGDVNLVGSGKDLNLEMKADLALKEKNQEIHLKTLGAIFKNQPLKLKKPISITVAGGDIDITPMTLALATFPVSIKGHKKGDNLNFKVKGEADLGLLSKLFLYTGDIVDGDLSLDLAIKGTASDPDISGFVALKNGEYENVIYGTKLHDLHMRATAKNKLIKLTEIKANDGHGGHILINGSYDLSKNAMDFIFKLVDMRFAYTDMMKVTGREGSFTLKGPLSKLKLAGKLKMGDTTYNVTNAFAGDVAELNIIDPLHPKHVDTKAEITAKKKEAEAFAMSMDLEIEIPPVVRIHGMGLESTWGGNLKVSGPATAPLVLGNITADNGELYFLGQDINIEKGELNFDGHENNIPYLNVLAGIPRGDFKVIVALKGRATKPALKLSSTPSMPQDQILSYLLFGSEPAKLSPFDAIKLAKLATEVAGLSSGSTLSDILKERTASKETEEEKAEKEKDYKSKSKLSDFVRVHLDQGITPEDTKVVVDVEVTPSITVTTSAGSGIASQSLGVNYKWDY